MGSLLAYSGIITKVKAMEKNLVNMQDFEKISQLESVSDFITFLKNHPAYKDIFGNLDEAILHRRKIEQLLIQPLYLDYAKIFRFSNVYQRKAVSFVFIRYEINILKSCLQCVFDSDTTYELLSFAPFFQKHFSLNISELLSAKDMDEFINFLHNTEYYELLNQTRNSNYNTMFDYGVQLDIYYFKKVWRLKDKLLKGVDLKIAEKIIGSQIDMLNIMWIYRSKRFYDIDPAKIYISTIPIKYKLTKTQYVKLVEAPGLEEFRTILSTTLYRTLSNYSHDVSIEVLYEKLVDKVYRKCKKEEPASMATLFCFLYLKERETDRLTTALECIRYNLPPDSILKFILDAGH